MKALMTLIVVAFTMPWLGGLSILAGLAYLAYAYIIKPMAANKDNEARYFLVGLLDKVVDKYIDPVVKRGKDKEAKSPKPPEQEDG